MSQTQKISDEELFDYVLTGCKKGLRWEQENNLTLTRCLAVLATRIKELEDKCP